MATKVVNESWERLETFFFSISRYDFLKDENLTALQYWAHVNVDAAVAVWVETRVLNMDQRAAWDLVPAAHETTDLVG